MPTSSLSTPSTPRSPMSSVPPRRSSVFADLLTVFRRKSTFMRPRRSIYHAVPPAESVRSASTRRDEEMGVLTRRESLNEVDREREDEEEGGEGTAAGKHPLTRQHLLMKIREKKEVINKLRCQAWNMNRKRRTLRLAQKYLEQNEPKVSRTHLYKEELLKRWHWFLRWLGNVGIYFVPWESRIKRIESQFGSVVSSYFTFLRWVIFVNLGITAIILTVIVVPECVADATADAGRQARTASRKHIPAEERAHADEWAVVWHYDGYVRFSPLFYGFYSNEPYLSPFFHYPLPLAYFLGSILVFCFSLFVILRRIALNARLSKLSGSKAEQYVFNWKLFTGWDYSIGNAETATNAAMAAVIKLRETINECQIHAQRRCVPSLWAIRLMTNTVIIGMILLSIFCIHTAVQKSETVEKSQGSLLTKNQVPLLMSTITHIFPMIFDLIGRIEKHHAKLSLRLHLIRISALYVINYATLIYSLFEKLDNIRDTRTADEPSTALGSEPPPPPFPGAVAERWRWAAAAAQQRHQAEQQEHRQQQQRPFYSRNFSTPRQLGQFFLLSAVQQQQRQERALAAEAKKEGSTTVTVDGSSVTVHAQFGPVGVNNPNALMRNTTAPSRVSAPYETRRVGPTPLPAFPAAPLPPTPRLPTFTGLNYGPDWAEIEREKERARARKRPTPAATPPNITVERPLDGLPLARDRTTPAVTVTTETPHPPTTLPPPLPVWRPAVEEGVWQVTVYPAKTPTSSTTTTTMMPPEEEEDAEDEDEDEEGHYNDQICWETMIGQEIVKLVTMDLYITIVSIFIIDFVRGLWIRYCSSWWCWDIETTFPEYGEFKVAENVLHICNNQGMVWLGLFFAPLLPAINNVKLMIIMYIRGWACTTCNVPAREIFRASRSSNFFLAILLSALLLCTVPVGYVITSKRPSTLCGPFAGRDRFYDVVTELIEGHVPKKVLRWLKYVASPGVIIPIILLLILFIFFLVSLVRGLRKANTDLQKQLIHERTEEKRKIFELAGGGNRKKGSSAQPAHLQVQQQKGGGRKVEQGQQLPEVERKRREPWRLFNNVNRKKEDASSLCPSDEPPSSLNSPSSECQQTLTADPFAAAKKQQRNPLANGEDWSSARASAAIAPYRPSLVSMEEAESVRTSDNTTDEGQQHPHRGRAGTGPLAVLGAMSKSQSDADDARRESGWPHLNQHQRPAQPLQHMDDGSPPSTPEEVRTLIAPYKHRPSLVSSSAVSLAAFPRDCSVSLGVLFGTNCTSLVSQRQDAQSIYDELHSPKQTSGTLAEQDQQQKAAASQMCIPTRACSKVYRLGGPLAPLSRPLIQSPRLISSPLMSRSDYVCGGTPSVEAPHRISLYSREPHRIGMPPPAVPHPVPQQQQQRQSVSPPKRIQPQPVQRQPSLPSSSSSKIIGPPQISKLTDQFVPWPSPDEVRRQRAQLLRPTAGRERPPSTLQMPLPHQPRARSPPKMIKSVHSHELTPPPEAPLRRFRISVSPTRKLEPAMEQKPPEPVEPAPPRRYVIKQQVFTGSTSTFGSSASGLDGVGPRKFTPNHAGVSNMMSGMGRAPRAVFGDDDSPRVENQPSPPQPGKQ